MNYTLHQLQVFLKVTQNKSITKAAEELSLTQPAISIQLKNFQEQFDLPLTEVIGRKLYITDFGLEIARAAENILNEVNEINFKTHAFKGQLFGRLRMSVVSTGKYVIPYYLSAFLKLNPGVELVLDVTNRQSVIRDLEDNLVDFSLVSVVPDKVKLNTLKLLQNKLYVVTSPSFDDIPSDVNLKTFESLPMIFREQGSGTRMVVEKFWQANNIKVRKKIELTSNEAVKQAVVAGLGCAVMPLIGIKNELKVGELKIIPMPNFPICSDWELVWHKDKKLSPVSQAYLDFLIANKDSIINDHFEWLGEKRYNA
jgi:LysR family transcriptional regulator, low CO2-responsive transcriptional regulator